MLTDLYPELDSNIDYSDDTIKIPIASILSKEEHPKLGRILAEYTVDAMPAHSGEETVNYTYTYYFNISTLPNSVLVDALIQLRKES